MNTGIYRIECIKTKKVYIGSAVRIDHRWRCHKSDMNLNKSKNKHLQSAWNKYGESSFVFSVIEFVNDKSNLIQREQFWIDKLSAVHNGYNLAPIAGNCIGVIHSVETRARMAASLSKDKRSENAKKGHLRTTPEQRSFSAKAAYASMDDEVKLKMIAGRLNSLTPEKRRLASIKAAETKRNNGYIVSDETRLKISSSLKIAYLNKTKEERSAIAKKSSLKFNKERRSIAGSEWQEKRPLEQRQNSARKGAETRLKNSGNGTGILGICFDKNRNKYQASMRMDKKQIYIGRFATLDEALNAYNNFEKNINNVRIQSASHAN